MPSSFQEGSEWMEWLLVRVARIELGPCIKIRPEPENLHDPKAAMLLDNGDGKVGYVPQYLTEDLDDLLKRATVAVEVERVNRIPAPVHQRLLCRMSASGATSFQPFSSERYQPLRVEAPGGAVTSAAFRRA